MTGTPVINDNGTPPGTKATHGFSTNHRCDDYVDGVDYKPLCVVKGGVLPDISGVADGKLHYLRWSFSEKSAPRFKKDGLYAFMIGFVEPGEQRNFTLSNRNTAAANRPAVMVDELDRYHDGWGLRREGNGVNPPRKVPGAEPPEDAEALRQLKEESAFPAGPGRYSITPTCDGYPDVDTYRDQEFYILVRNVL